MAEREDATALLDAFEVYSPTAKDGRSVKIGVVQTATTTGAVATCRILFDGETVTGGKQYPCLSSYIPVVGDRVIVNPVGSSTSWIVTGAIKITSTAGTTIVQALNGKGAKAKPSSTVSLSAGTGVAIATTTTVFNDDTSMFTINTDGITVLQAGLYLVTIAGSVGLGSSGQFALYGTPGAFGEQVNGTGGDRVVSAPMKLAANQKVQGVLLATVSGSANASTDVQTYVSVVRLGDGSGGYVAQSPNGAYWKLTPSNSGASVWTAL